MNVHGAKMAYIRLTRVVKVFSNPFEPHIADSGQEKPPIYSDENLSDPPTVLTLAFVV